MRENFNIRSCVQLNEEAHLFSCATDTDVLLFQFWNELSIFQRCKNAPSSLQNEVSMTDHV